MNRLLLACALWLATVGLPASAQSPDATVAKAAAEAAAAARSAAPEAAAEPADRVRPATLRVFNRAVVTFRSSFLGVTPSERAVIARERIYSLLEKGGPLHVTVATIPQGKMIAIDGAFAFVVADHDVAAGAGETLDTAASMAQGRLEVVIAETREARDA